MKSFVGVLCVLIVAVSLTSGYPDEWVEDEVQPQAFENSFAAETGNGYVIRPKRATCDLLSGFGVEHSACAAHCVIRGYRGGWCDSRSVCNCRR